MARWLVLIFLFLSGCTNKPMIYQVMRDMSSERIDYRGMTVDARGKVKFKYTEYKEYEVDQ